MAKKQAKKVVKKSFDISSLQPESGLAVTPRTNEQTVEIYNKLNELAVGQSYKMPIELFVPFTNAKITLKRVANKIIISRKLDKFNFRCWRLADDTRLRTYSKKKK
jgi:hypothetical protein